MKIAKISKQVRKRLIPYSLFLAVIAIAGQQPARAETCIGIPLSECNALYALYDSTGGDNWYQHSNWKSMQPVSQWTGITVVNGHVSEIDLSLNNLSGQLPAEIGAFTELTGLDMTGNNLQGSLPETIGDLVNLEYLSFWDNRLQGTLPAGLTNLVNLRSLDLSTNFFTGGLPSGIGYLSRLEYLWMENNRFSGSIPNTISNLSNLRLLSLYRNQLEGSIPKGIGEMDSLLYLYLDSNFLTGSIPDSLGTLLNIVQIYLGDNRLSGEVPPSLYGLNNIESLSLRNNLLSGNLVSLANLPPGIRLLDLSENQFTGAIPENLGTLTGLRSLNLNGNGLSGGIPSSLGGLSDLNFLFLHQNQLTGSIPGEIGNLSNLVILSLHSNQLEGNIPQELGNLTALNSLYLTNNRLSGEIPAALGLAGQLRMVGFSNNMLEGTIPASLEELEFIRGIWASGNRMSGELPGFTATLPESIDFRWNQLRASDPLTLARLEARHGNKFTSTQNLPPTNLEAHASGPEGDENRIDLAWTPISYGSDDGGYEIFFKKGWDSDYTRVGMTGDKWADSYTIPNLQPGTDYSFRIRSVTWEHPNNQNPLFSPEVDFPLVTAGTTSRAFIPVWKRGEDKFTGIAISNFGGDPINVSLAAWDENGNLENAQFNPVQQQIPPHQQISLLGGEFFGGGDYTSDLSWVELTADNTNTMGALFLFGVRDTSMLDGAKSQTRYAKKIFFTRPIPEGILDDPSADIQLSILNPFEDSLTVKLTLVGEEKSIESEAKIIPARGFMAGGVAELFDGDPEISNAYLIAETTDGQGITGFARTEFSGIRTSLGLNAAEASQDRILYSAQIAEGEGITTSIRLVNTSPEDREIQLSAIKENGSLFSPSRRILLKRESVFEGNFSDLFPVPENGISVASLQVSTDGGGVIGDVIFADGETLDYAMALPLQTEPFKEAIFNHVANLPGLLFTGIALLNPGDETAEIDIEVFGVDGSPVAATTLFLGPGKRLSRTLTDPDMWPDLPVQSGGYITIRSTQPIVGQQLFGESYLRYMAAIPPTTRLEPIFEE